MSGLRAQVCITPSMHDSEGGSGCVSKPSITMHVTPLRCSRALALRYLAQRFRKPLAGGKAPGAGEVPAVERIVGAAERGAMGGTKSAEGRVAGGGTGLAGGGSVGPATGGAAGGGMGLIAEGAAGEPAGPVAKREAVGGGMGRAEEEAGAAFRSMCEREPSSGLSGASCAFPGWMVVLCGAPQLGTITAYAASGTMVANRAPSEQIAGA